MKVILSSTKFKVRYTINVRLIPKITMDLDDITKSQIQRAILQHDQIMANLRKALVPGIQYLDGNLSKKIPFSLRELMLQLTSEIDGSFIFVSVDRNFTDTAFEVKYKLKYEKEAKIMASKLGAYLVKKHGTTVYKIFSSDYQTLTKNCKWVNNAPLFEEELELETALDAAASLDWVMDLSDMPTQTTTMASQLEQLIQEDGASFGTFTSVIAPTTTCARGG